jgi:hypothetical protein
MQKFEEGKAFDWDDLSQLLRRTAIVDPKKITTDCTKGYRFLLSLTEEEKLLANDPYQRERKLCQNCGQMHIYVVRRLHDVKIPLYLSI